MDALAKYAGCGMREEGSKNATLWGVAWMSGQSDCPENGQRNYFTSVPCNV